MADALALLAYDSVATGLSALDTLVKEAPVTVLEANLVEPGRFLILFVGGVAEAEGLQLRLTAVAAWEGSLHPRGCSAPAGCRA